ncbi:hypothetical protein ABH903_002386 [Brevibacterium epidermidis]|uniref:Transposase n=1 Tax=Brevibacterium epidermidis TaxID=1698 RepID=A0ABV4ELD2_BREEP
MLPRRISQEEFTHDILLELKENALASNASAVIG